MRRQTGPVECAADDFPHLGIGLADADRCRTNGGRLNVAVFDIGVHGDNNGAKSPTNKACNIKTRDINYYSSLWWE